MTEDVVDNISEIRDEENSMIQSNSDLKLNLMNINKEKKSYLEAPIDSYKDPGSARGARAR